jgi:uncharacterized protein
VRRTAWLLVAAAISSCSKASPAPTPSNEQVPTPGGRAAHVLVVTHTEGFRHPSIPDAEATLLALGLSSGLFTVSFCRTADDVSRLLVPSALVEVDAIVFANTTGNLPVLDLTGLLDWIARGHGFVGVHSAADTYHDAPAYLDMLGNEFLTHGNQTTVEAIVETPSHPASMPLGARFRVFDEIYKFTRANRGGVTMLLSLDRQPDDGAAESGQPADLPLAWAKSYGQGRVFYTALGHREDVWQNALYQQHVLGGLRWVLNR